MRDFWQVSAGRHRRDAGSRARLVAKFLTTYQLHLLTILCSRARERRILAKRSQRVLAQRSHAAAPGRRTTCGCGKRSSAPFHCFASVGCTVIDGTTTIAVRAMMREQVRSISEAQPVPNPLERTTPLRRLHSECGLLECPL